jgi:uncharacterized protein YebE (UPF0316 family)
MEYLLNSLAMTGLAVTSVGLWTLRVALTARGRKVAGSLTAAAEALVFLLAFSSVASNIEALHLLAGYGLGVGLGTFFGLLLDERFSTGQSEVRIVTEGTDLSLVSDLHERGWPVTWTQGSGPFGEVTVAFVAVDNVKVKSLVSVLERFHGKAFWTVEALRKAQASPVGRGWIQVGQGLLNGVSRDRMRPSKSDRQPMVSMQQVKA